ncbi:DUF4405 domain-containing protein [Cohaesibacter celericrescens]|uniref:Uncharacterized protein n=1 Tax=Cohaesibacter celericrescens TaxID=2067669 RepID=A0A2N5XQ27_9HYPH|nr:DUF4405 domain-containing protein [Cohaesibacter celericrescens]PLW76594.1 hypothetical protein C0081_13885 [Cohaesibacter celericrescens]
MSVQWTRPLPRLMLDGLLLGLLVLGFSYWWLGNGVHELVGTIFLIFILRHVANNLFWWKNLPKGNWNPQRLFNLALGILLAIALFSLLVSSIFLSRALTTILPLPRIFIMQEIHWFSAYWAIALSAMHVGVNWNRILSLALMLVGKRNFPGWLKIAGWVTALAISVQALKSGMVVGLWDRLAFQYSLSMWDFNEAVLPFFLHWSAVLIGLATLSKFALFLTVRFKVALFQIEQGRRTS